MGILTRRGLGILWNLADQQCLDNQEELTPVKTLIDQADHEAARQQEEDLGL